LPKVVEELRTAGYDKILVVGGGSTDGTLEGAEELGVATVMQIGKGKGMVLRNALMYVDTPYVAIMDADYSYPPAEVRKLLPYLRHYDLVLGARQSPMPLIYKLGNKALAWLFRLLFGADITDPLTGMYAARTDVLREAALEARNFDIGGHTSQGHGQRRPRRRSPHTIQTTHRQEKAQALARHLNSV